MTSRLALLLLPLALLASCARPDPALAPAAMTGPSPSFLVLRAAPGDRAHASFEVGNAGGGTLVLEVTPRQAWLDVRGATRRVLGPGETVRVGVEAACPADDPVGTDHGSLRVTSDGPAWWVADVIVRRVCEAPTPPEDRGDAGNDPPRAVVEVAPASGSLSAPAEATFTGAGSFDPDGRVVRHAWTIDGWAYDGESVAHVFEAAGTHAIELTVVDDDGASDTLLTWYVVGEGGAGDAPEEPDDPADPGEDPGDAPGDEGPADPADPPDAPADGFDVTLRFYGSRLPDASQRQVFEDAAARWSEVIAAGLPDRAVDLPPGDCFGIGEPAHRGTIDDVLIFASLAPIDGPEGVLASAGACILRNDSRLPLVGLMEFDEADFDRLAGRGLLRDTVLHEMGHVLGIGTLWEAGGRALIDPAGCGWGGEARFDGREATRQHERIGGFGRPHVETDGGGGTACGHWDEARYGGELMTGWIGGGMELSRMTVGSLADLGYEVDAERADAYRVPSGARLRGPEEGEPLGEILLAPTRVLD